MKNVVISLIILFLIFTGGILSGSYIDDFSKEMGEQNNEIKRLIEKENYADAQLEAIDMYASIKEHISMLSFVIENTTIDNIERNLQEMISYIKEEQRHDALAKCDVLSIMFMRLPRNFNLKKETIF